MKKYLRNILTSPPVKTMVDPKLKKELSMIFYIKRDGKIFYKDFIEGDEKNVRPPSIREIKKGCDSVKTRKVVLVHNHPSGVAEPSTEDLLATEVLMERLNKVGIRLVDHIIVCSEGYHSIMRNSG